jgi:hypothetical protein
MKKSLYSSVSHGQIQRAVRQFELAGGHIVRIPAQPTPRSSRVAFHQMSFTYWSGTSAPVLPVSEAITAAVEGP